MASPTDNQKKIFAVAALANIGNTQSGLFAPADTLNGIKTALSTMQGQIGTWDVVWGPSLSLGLDSKGNLVSNNTMYVAQKANTHDYVIGIAGTSGNSPVDFLVEDNWVTSTVLWSTVIGSVAPSAARDAGNAAISQGTAIGLNNLLSTMPWIGIPGALSTIESFLAAESSKGPMNLTVCGHSLGGALAPALALYLQNTKSTWDENGSSTVITMPVAGPTPGNGDFASYLSKTVTVQGFYNPFDVVPHAWAPTDLGQIPKLYVPQIPECWEVDALGLVAVGLSVVGTGTGSPYTPTARATLDGAKICTDIITGGDAFKDFLAQLGYQHLNAYATLLGPAGTETLLAQVLRGTYTDQISANVAAAIEKQAGRTIPSSIQVAPRSQVKRVASAK
ncbi:hypothetical protein BO221_36555 [Archangium sp. Cb G35]|nr:hypothetical protein BO221_36555 [Archangium sp. Cb G35]